MKKLALIILSLLLSLSAFAQTDTIRYVLTTGSYRNNGLSWTTAKDNIQDAINDLNDYLKRHNLPSGRVYVGAGVYVPTESTEASGDGILYTAFKIPEGVSVYGGFAADGKIYQPAGTTTPSDRPADKQPGQWQTSPDDRLMQNGKTQGENNNNNNNTNRHKTADDMCRGWEFDSISYTYLSGNHARSFRGKDPGGYLRWNSARQRYDEVFPGNSYHVVWFATNGLIESDDPKTQGHYKPLNKPALLDGCVVIGGHASSQIIDSRQHASFGGGVYMVEGATVRNCRITENAATRKGGGVYMDGGGTVEYCYIRKNQAKGIGLTDGYGGGLAMEHNGRIRYTVMWDNAASIGGGMAMEHSHETYPDALPAVMEGTAVVTPAQKNFNSAFAPSASGCVLANNTAATEGGGLAMLSGGTVNHLTIVRNHCAGNLVTLNSRRYGRSGGMFIDNGGVVFNSVIWGNTTANNGNVQYSAYVPRTPIGDGVQPYLNFTAVGNHDDAEWTGTFKQVIYPLQEENTRRTSGRHLPNYYPEFTSVTELVNGIAGVEAAGQEISWIPKHTSDLVAKGVRLRDYVTKRANYMINATVTYDIYGNRTAPISTLGAYMSESVIDGIASTEANAVNPIDTKLPAGKTIVKTLFVDPSYKASSRDGSANLTNRGESWDNPLVFLGDAIHWVSDQYAYYAANNENVIYQILVKEGNVTAVDRQANIHVHEDYLRLRDLSLTMVNYLRIYGGFDGRLEGTDIESRNPIKFPTVVSANVSGLTYADNAAHVVTFDNVSNAILDGFKFYGGNTRIQTTLFDEWTPQDADGAGILIKGGANNTIRNCFIANCRVTDGQGAAIYANNTANLTCENLVIHNNAVDTATINKQRKINPAYVPASVYITGGSTGVSFDHCLLRGNMGGIVSDGAGTTVRVTNTAFHANAKDTTLTNADIESGDKLINNSQSGHLLMAVHATNGGQFYDCAANLMDDDLKELVTIEGFTGMLTHNPNNNSTYTYPTFANPTTSIGVNENGLVTFYGGTADFTPDNMNPLVNRAQVPEGQHVGYDITTLTSRDFGGEPDIGPVENPNLPANGTVIYVRWYGMPGTYDATKYTKENGYDGSSWARAIDGNNPNYFADHGFTVPNGECFDEQLYKEGTRLTGLQWAVDEAFKRHAVKDTVKVEGTDSVILYTPYAESMSGGIWEKPRQWTLVKRELTKKPMYFSKVDTARLVQVWVAEGEYLRRDGFFMRNSVDVIGGFPAVGTPGLAEKDPKEYETIIETFTTPVWEELDRQIKALQGHSDSTKYVEDNVGKSEFIVFGDTITIPRFCETGSNWDENQRTHKLNHIPDTCTYDLNNYTHAYGTKRVLTQQIPYYRYEDTKEFQTDANGKNWGGEILDTKVDPIPELAYTKETTWNGFTIRHGIVSLMIARDGGGGASLRYNGALENCVITKNRNRIERRARGGGVYCMSGTIRNCVISHNVMEITGARGARCTEGHGGGLGMRRGVVYNTVFHDNTAYSSKSTTRGYSTENIASALYFQEGIVLNCTFYNNEGYVTLGTSCYFGNGTLNLYNSLAYGNTHKGTGKNANKAIYMTKSNNAAKVTIHNTILSDGIILDKYNGQDSVNPAVIDTLNLMLTKPENPFESLVETNSKFLRLKSNAFLAINKGTDDLHMVDFYTHDTVDFILPDLDAAYTDRVKDCRVDIGAYEYDGALDIEPDETSQAETAIYYVTENGNGLATANSVENAACWRKLQKVLDAAGRYKYNNPTHNVIVRLAAFGDVEAQTGYAPTYEVVRDDYNNELRTSKTTNPLAYSITVSRGVTLEGGYNEDFTERDILKNKTILTGFTNDKHAANVYHVLNFTEAVYDKDHNLDTLSNGALKRLTDDLLTDKSIDRAIVDGVFITGGQAIGEHIDRTASNKAAGIKGYSLIDAFYNPNSCGGAAIVPSYAHIRNCVIEGNTAVKGGGGLLLKPRALVSGCIFRNNQAIGTAEGEGQGGAVYVYEPNTTDETNSLFVALSDDNPFDPAGDIYRPTIAGREYRYANIFTSTIANNTANSGGGVYFTSNLRMNSSVLWRNTANSNANIAGSIMPELYDDRELAPWEYPLQYCAVENQRVQGYNNISVASESVKGTRWADANGRSDAALLADNAFFYGLKSYSLLTRTGMLMSDYNMLISGVNDDVAGHYHYFPSLSPYDIAGVQRTQHSNNDYIEIGARVLDKDVFNEDPTFQYLMKRLYVAMPEDVDLDKAEVMQNNTIDDDYWRPYYQQEGSSMAFPFNRFDDALNYIQRARKYAYELYYKEGATNEDKQRATDIANTRFEIYLAQGTHYPYRTIKGAYSNTRGNTFLIPEGVAVYGGISAKDDKLGHLGYATDDDESLTVTDDHGHEVVITNAKTVDILAGRARYDINQNGIIEGWGFENQTILSGDVVNSDNIKNVFHIISAIAAEEYVGLLPKLTQFDNTDTWNGSSYKERGLPIILDGLQITGGEAIGYDPAVQSTSTYYKGGAICVDGNWATSKGNDEAGNPIDRHMEMELDMYKDHISSSKADGDRSYFDMAKRSVGYRDIPLVVRNSYITNNKACMGGAIFTNGTLQMYSTQLAQNTALMYTDEGVNLGEANNNNNNTVTYYGRGGGLQSTYLTVLVNCVFANNSAVSNKEEVEDATTTTHFVDKNGNIDETTTYDIPNGTGGAICIGEYGMLEMINCHVVRNKADGYPAIYAFAPNAGYKDVKKDPDLSVNQHVILNTVFWGNENVITPSWNLNAPSQHYEYVMNPVSPFRYEGPEYGDDAEYMGYPEALWFCAYEPGKWYEPRVLESAYTDNENDVRRMPFNRSNMATQIFVPEILKDYYAEKEGFSEIANIDRYNFNIHINPINGKSDGPNFISPSLTAGAEGYMPSADWMMSRMNNLVDWGWTFMKQEVTDSGTKFITDESLGGKKGCGPYYQLAENINNYSFYDGATAMPIEEQPYMIYFNDGRSMLRISKDPNPTHNQTYIDIGAYEYPHVPLKVTTVGDELVDILWVTEKERTDEGELDGSTWSKATSDLQRAIETLFSTRNDHHKEIRMLAGNYAPRYTISGNRAFIINTHYQDNNSVIPDASENVRPLEDEGFGVRSLTIRGGYSDVVKGQYNPEDYPSIITMNSTDNSANNIFNYAFLIEDARQRVKNQHHENTALDYVIPITIEGVTFSNGEASGGADAGGAAIYYREQLKQDEGEDHSELLPPVARPTLTAPLESSDEDEPADIGPSEAGSQVDVRNGYKLVVKNCVFTGNGKNQLSVQPAVKIERGGGEALIYNSLWHHNNGNSIDAVSTKVLNCTFALNKGQVKLDNNSQLHNSILWSNGANQNIATDVARDIKQELAEGTSPLLSYNAIMGFNESEGNTNNTLSIVNDDVENGPNFKNIDENDFSVMPCRLITGRASALSYMNLVTDTVFTTEKDALDSLQHAVAKYTDIYTYIEGETCGEEDCFDVGAHQKYYLQYHDASNFSRLFDGGLERGAYESRAKLNRVMYLRPNKTEEGTGETWEKAYGASQLQVAINAAAVYSQAHSGASSYVFIKGSDNTNFGNITLRNGVMLYGSIQNTFMDEATRDDNNFYADNDSINRYVAKVLNDETRCIAGTATTRTVLTGFTAGKNVKSQLDGFEFTPVNTSTEHTEPIIQVEEGAAGIALRNCIIHDYKMDTENHVPLLDLQGYTLLYNSLVRDNNAPIHLSKYAFIENSTIVSNDNAITTTNLTYGDNANRDGNFLNSIDFCGNVVQHDILSRSPFAAYFHEKNTYYNGDLDPSFTSNRNLWYQLHEMSEYLERVNVPTYHHTYKYDVTKDEYVDGAGGNMETDKRLPDVLKYFVNYRADRDLLGNPRVINFGSSGPIASAATPDAAALSHVFIDYGCYETWTTGNPAEGIGSDSTHSILFPSRNPKYYGGNYYPHEGSVVYINKDGKIVLDNTTTDGHYNGFTGNNPFRPGYLLIREGGSLFGQGGAVDVSYVAVQRNLKKRYALMSLPFPLKKALGKRFPTMYTTVAHIIYDMEGGVGVVGKAFSQTGEKPEDLPDEYFDPLSLKGYYYNGDTRAAWDYKYADTLSTCWEEIPDGSVIPANKGWLIDAGSVSEEERIIRFTGYGNNMRDWIYKETTENPYKVINLTQHDIHQTQTGKAEFTDEYNMGWNLTGVPYLVSAYRTGRELEEGESGYGTHTYTMSAPRIIYALDNNSAYQSFESWENNAGDDLTVIQGFFTQTATKNATEPLHFVVPKYETATTSAPSSIVAFRRGDNSSSDDAITLHPAAQNGSLTYSLGSDGAKFMSPNTDIAQMYAIGTSSLRMSLLSKAPINTEIPLGLRIPAADTYTFTLPTPEAFQTEQDTLSVWLIDKLAKKVSNLMLDDYSVYLDEEKENVGRFYLAVSVQEPKVEGINTEANYTVIAHNQKLTIKGLTEGDYISVYTPSGLQVAEGIANGSTWSTAVQNNSLYIVKVNHQVLKTLCQ